jgi:hypothetical protein
MHHGASPGKHDGCGRVVCVCGNIVKYASSDALMISPRQVFAADDIALHGG